MTKISKMCFLTSIVPIADILTFTRFAVNLITNYCTINLEITCCLHLEYTFINPKLTRNLDSC